MVLQIWTRFKVNINVWAFCCICIHCCQWGVFLQRLKALSYCMLTGMTPFSVCFFSSQTDAFHWEVHSFHNNLKEAIIHWFVHFQFRRREEDIFSTNILKPIVKPPRRELFSPHGSWGLCLGNEWQTDWFFIYSNEAMLWTEKWAELNNDLQDLLVHLLSSPCMWSKDIDYD